MATAQAKTDNLEKLAADFKKAAATLEGFTTTLHKDVAALKWEGGSADKFKTAIKSEESMLASAITKMHTISARLRNLSDDAATTLKKLEADEKNLVAEVKKNVNLVEQTAQADHETVKQFLAAPNNQPLKSTLKSETQQYNELAAEIKSVGAI